MLLKVMTFTGNVNRTLLLVGKAHTCDLSQSRVRLLGGSRGYGQTYAAFLGAVIENRTFRFESNFLSALFDELIDSRHKFNLLVKMEYLSKNCPYAIKESEKLSAVIRKNRRRNRKNAA